MVQAVLLHLVLVTAHGMVVLVPVRDIMGSCVL